MHTLKQERRRPRQERSKKRVDNILSAAKYLIADKGTVKLKIHDIADKAEVTPASIYQYFPSKHAIILALVDDILNTTQSKLIRKMPEMTSMNEACEALRYLIEEHYQVYLDDPALSDVWMIISADKALQKLDLEDSRKISEIIISCFKKFYRESHWERLTEVSFLLAHMAGSAIRMSIAAGPVEGRPLLEAFKTLISPQSIDIMLQVEASD